jgi:hypothetical protein
MKARGQAFGARRSASFDGHRYAALSRTCLIRTESECHAGRIDTFGIYHRGTRTAGPLVQTAQ